MNACAYQTRKSKLVSQTLKQDSVTTNQQINQMRETKTTLALMRKKAEDLIVKASIDFKKCGGG